MTNFIPIFPLNIVVFPGEEVNLHLCPAMATGQRMLQRCKAIWDTYRYQQSAWERERW